jgi:hypothetical protein
LALSDGLVIAVADALDQRLRPGSVSKRLPRTSVPETVIYDSRRH